MKKINLFLRFTDEDAWRTYAATHDILTIVEQPILDENGDETEETETIERWNYFTHDRAISDIGIVYNDDGVYDEETGDVITPPTAKDGWHVNWKSSSFPPNILDYELMPANVYRVWSGDPVSLDLRTTLRYFASAIFN